MVEPVWFPDLVNEQGLYKTYPREQAATMAVICRNQRGSVDSTTGKPFTVRSFAAFPTVTDVYKWSMAIPPADRNFFECIFGERPQKPYFDLDSPDDYNPTIPWETVEHIVTGLLHVLKVDLRDIRIYSSTEPRQRLHMVVRVSDTGADPPPVSLDPVTLSEQLNNANPLTDHSVYVVPLDYETVVPADWTAADSRLYDQSTRGLQGSIHSPFTVEYYTSPPAPLKESYHIVLPTWYCSDKGVAKAVCTAVLATVPTEYHRYVDRKVYKSLQQLRVLWSRKVDTSRAKRLLKKWQYQGMEIVTRHPHGLYDQFTESFVGYFDPETPEAYRTVPLTAPPEPVMTYVGGDLPEDVVEGALALLEARLDPHAVLDKVKGPFILLKRTRASVCPVCQSQTGWSQPHVGNNPYLLVRERNVEWYDVYYYCRSTNGSGRGGLLGSLQVGKDAEDGEGGTAAAGVPEPEGPKDALLKYRHKPDYHAALVVQKMRSLLQY